MTDSQTSETADPSVPLTAPAADQPCSMYRHTGGQIPVITHGHHLYPIYLQNRKYGRIEKGDIVWLCGTCHDNVHAWIYFLMGERRQPNPQPPFRARRLAELAVNWFNTAEPEPDRTITIPEAGAEPAAANIGPMGPTGI